MCLSLQMHNVIPPHTLLTAVCCWKTIAISEPAYLSLKVRFRLPCSSRPSASHSSSATATKSTFIKPWSRTSPPERLSLLSLPFFPSLSVIGGHLQGGGSQKEAIPSPAGKQQSNKQSLTAGTESSSDGRNLPQQRTDAKPTRTMALFNAA